MLTQQDIYVVGSENHPPMLNKDNYVPWSSSLLRYSKSKPNGKLLMNFVLYGPYVRRMIVKPDDPDHKTPIAESFHEQITQPGMNMGQDREIKMVSGNGENQFRQYVGQHAGYKIRYNVRQIARNQNGYNTVQNAGNQNANQNGNGNVVAARTKGNGNRNNRNKIKCYNCRGVGHYARNYTQASTLNTQTDKALVYDLDGSAEDDIIVILMESSMAPSGGELEHHHDTVEQTYAYIESLYNNLVNEVKKVNTGKSKKAPHKPKPIPNYKKRLHLIYKDLYGPMSVESINGKWYVMVIVDDYSRYTWVYFLISKDEALEVIKTFLKKIYFLLQASVIINDHEDIGKLGVKGDVGFFLGYPTTSYAYRVYNRGQPLDSPRTTPATPTTQNLQTPNAYTTTANSAPTPTNSSSQAPTILNILYHVDACTHPLKRLTSFCFDDDDDEDYTSAITPDEPVLSTEEPDNSLCMGDEHLDTIPATESDEFIKSGVEDLIPIPSESEGIPEHVCDVPFHENSLPLEVSKDQIKDFSEPNEEFSSTDDDSYSLDNIDYVEASPPDFELVSSEVMEIVIPEVGGIKASNDNPIPSYDPIIPGTPPNLTPSGESDLFSEGDMLLFEAFLNDDHSSDFKTKSSSTSLNSLLEETNNFHNSLPEFTTFSKVLFNAEYESDSSDDQSSSDEYILKKIVSKPLSEEEIIPMESLSTHDSSLPILSKIDSLLDEFAGELTLLKSIPPGIDETDCDFEEDIRLIEKLLYDNSSPRPPEEFVFANSDAASESFSPSPILVKEYQENDKIESKQDKNKKCGEARRSQKQLQ
uniref:Putative ribonuclease H-like domain-containing protein n=1 Tax=Tanacetum cinerariifolium TaxID=118510 RepID=A0A6L2MTZ6_TANCI|nr:putative ribonuclease H-like domain-containing protein [Tanacetum cinerariifolium]